MARIPYLSRDDLAPEDKQLLARDINLMKALVNSPGGARAFGQLGNYIRHESKVDPRLREMAILQVGYLAHSRYEFSHHVKIGRDFGVTDDDVHAIRAETRGKGSNLPMLDRAVLLAAREMTNDGKISSETFAVLKQSMDAEAITDLVITIAFYCGVVRLLESLKIDVEPEYQQYLDEFPLPNDS